jgi:hypothetical protein
MLSFQPTAYKKSRNKKDKILDLSDSKDPGYRHGYKRGKIPLSHTTGITNWNPCEW